MEKQNIDLYNDMLYMPHPVSKTHPPMDRANRAAQFAPFAALTGYEEAVREEARITEQKRELDEDEKARLDKKFGKLIEHLHEKPEVIINYFQADTRKEGGSYVTKQGQIRKLDVLERLLWFADGEGVSLDMIRDIQW